jgi:hypothetical protein
MSVSATNVEPVAVAANRVRYGLSLDWLGTGRKGFLFVQRSEQRADGTWIDDPRPASSKTVPMPTTGAMTTAVDGLAALLPPVLAALGVSDPFTRYRLSVRGRLSAAGALDVAIVAQVFTTAWQVKTIPSLAAFVAAQPALAAPVASAWDALDAAINAANAEERWL